MKKYTRYIIISICSAVLLMSSCADWLDVKPKTAVPEEELYSKEMGFMEALTGIYIKMGNTSLYGKNLSYGFLDILGQRYFLKGSTSDNKVYQNELYYSFPSWITESYTEAIWRNMYNTIANTNNLISWTEKNRHVLVTPHYYEVIRGEALGLRAFMHFDLLRMYGPILKNNPDAKRMAYRKEFNRDAKGFSSASEIIEDVITDLKEAESLLNGHDPLLFDFPKDINEETRMTGDPFFVYRHKRMNLYAVKALLARAYLYAGNKTEAAKYAQEVIDSKRFNLVAEDRDQIHSTEILFSIYIHEFEKQVINEFNSPGGGLCIAEEPFFSGIFEFNAGGSTDSRAKIGVAFESGSVYSVRKYNQTNIWPSIEGTIPLMRLPEMYYILAECSNDYDKSASYLNTVRSSRDLDGRSFSTEKDKLSEIEKEYRKEFYAEGQLFFFYKRHAYETFLNCPIKKMTDANYMFRWPDDEDLFGITD